MAQTSGKRPQKMAGTDAGAVGPADLPKFFYPIHYQIATAIEDVLSDGVLSRKQVVILQLIRSGGRNGRMRRKDIELAMKRWFEVTSSQISKALRGMARPPLQLIELSEDPTSGREKLVGLTPYGEQFLSETTTRAETYLAALIKDISPELLACGAEYLRCLTEAYERVPAPPRLGVVRALDDDRDATV